MEPKSKAAALAGLVLYDQPGHLLRRCQQLAIELYYAEVAAKGPTPRQFAVLLTIGQQCGLQQSDLVHRTGIDRSTIGEMISRLSQRGLVTSKRRPHDRRANELALTAAGRTLVQAAMPAVRRAQLRILAPLSAARRKSFIRSLQILADAAPPEPTKDG